MKLIGALIGEYEGNKYAKLIFTEPYTRAGGYGFDAVISKAQYNYVIEEIIPVWDMIVNQEVTASYDRYGKVQSISLRKSLADSDDVDVGV